MLDGLIKEVANVGFTLLVVVVAIMLVRWIDNNIFNNRKK